VGRRTGDGVARAAGGAAGDGGVVGIRGVAEVPVEDLHLVVLDLAVVGIVLRGEETAGVGAQPEAGIRRADRRTRRDGDGEGVGPCAQRGVRVGRDDMLPGVGPVLVGVEVDPRVEVGGPGAPDDDRDRGILSHHQGRGEGDAVLVVGAVVVVTGGRRIGLAVAVGVRRGGAQVRLVGVDRVADAAVGVQRRIAKGVRIVRRVPVVVALGPHAGNGEKGNEQQKGARPGAPPQPVSSGQSNSRCSGSRPPIAHGVPLLTLRHDSGARVLPTRGALTIRTGYCSRCMRRGFKTRRRARGWDTARDDLRPAATACTTPRPHAPSPQQDKGPRHQGPTQSVECCTSTTILLRIP